MSLITSPHNPRVKEAAKLRQRGGRDAQQRIIVDGRREIRRALAADVELLELFLDAAAADDETRQLAADARRRDAAIIECAPPVFAKLAFGDRREGVVATARPPRRSLAELHLPPRPLVAVLEAVEKPGNLGAVLRSADAAGLAAVIVADPVTDLYNPNAIRASLGAIFLQQLVAAPAAVVKQWLLDRQFHILAARVDGSTPYTAIDYSSATAIVLGAESRGLSSHWQGPDVTAVAIPMRGVVDSLNVSTTAAVLFFEAARSRPADPGPPRGNH